ncbi:MAG: hypothetical protein ACO20W_09500, partial [Anaerohalosphaeraceae bacterium]
GFTVPEMFEYLRIGYHTLMGDYGVDPWIQDQGADPYSSPYIDWSDAANPLISYAPPYNTSDPNSRDATARLGYVGFSASIFEEQNPIFSPNGNYHEMFGPFGMYHASADRQVDPEIPDGMSSYPEYLMSITDFGELNTWLIEEVEWSTRYCNDQDRLTDCPAAPGNSNRENNMVDPLRWQRWMELLDFVKEFGQPMTLGDYSLAMAFDNAPTVSNPGQADADHNGIGDVVDLAVLTAADVTLECGQGNLVATLTYESVPLTDQELVFTGDFDGDNANETYTVTTDVDGVATVAITSPESLGTTIPYTVSWVAVVAEGCDPTVDCVISSITSNEPVDYPEPELAPDWMITSDLTAGLRAERLGEGNGRIYTIFVTCTDSSGNTASASIEVKVPHDQKSPGKL